MCQIKPVCLRFSSQTESLILLLISFTSVTLFSCQKIKKNPPVSTVRLLNTALSKAAEPSLDNSSNFTWFQAYWRVLL